LAEIGTIPESGIIIAATASHISVCELIIAVANCQKDNRHSLLVVIKSRSAIVWLLNSAVFAINSTQTIWKIPSLVKSEI
jgi:hypothetical protein